MDDANPYRSPDMHWPEPPDGSALASGSPFRVHFKPPRLRILHLMGWITAAAILFRIGMVFDAARAEVSTADVQVFLQALRLFSNAVTAASVVGGGILVAGWMRGIRGPLQPGHWLIVVNSSGFVLSYALLLTHLVLMKTVLGPWEDGYSFVAYMGGLGFLSFTQILLWYTAAWRTVDGMRWKTFFKIVSAAYGIRMLLCVLDILTYENWTYRLGAFFSVSLGMILVIVVALDRRRGPPRDWLHWVGVGIACCHSLNALLWVAWKFSFAP